MKANLLTSTTDNAKASIQIYNACATEPLLIPFFLDCLQTYVFIALRQKPNLCGYFRECDVQHILADVGKAQILVCNTLKQRI